MQTQEKALVIKAINDLGRRVTAADIATRTGLPILSTTCALNQIASETRGHLEVGTTGDIAYRFNAGFQNTYLAEGLRKVMQQAAGYVFKLGYYLLRISFGIGLIVSLIIIVLLIVLVLLALRGGDDRNDNSGFSLDFFDCLIVRDAWTTPYPGTYIDYNRPSTRVPQKKGNFLLNCFSFLFGDGNPNKHLEERKWQLVAQAIKNNNGVVTAEQLAPFTGADPGNDDGVLPVLVRFNGTPEVTDKGNIIYQFPSLQVSAAGSRVESAPTYLREFPWQFSSVPGDQLDPVYLLAGFNFLGSWLLLSLANIKWCLLHNHAFAPLIGLLVIYGTLFVLVPFVRYLAVQWLNRRIESRNQARENHALLISSPSEELLTKLEEAKQLRIGEKRLTADNVVYTTDKDLLDQEFDTTP